MLELDEKYWDDGTHCCQMSFQRGQTNKQCKMPEDSYVFPLSWQCWRSQLGKLRFLAIAKMLMPMQLPKCSFLLVGHFQAIVSTVAISNAIAKMP